jgi:hypothetical protein
LFEKRRKEEEFVSYISNTFAFPTFCTFASVLEVVTESLCVDLHKHYFHPSRMIRAGKLVKQRFAQALFSSK